MFLERYKDFKKTIEEKNSFYEYNSVGENPLFGLSEIITENPNKEFDISFLSEVQKEADIVNLKVKFIKGFLKEYKDKLIDQSIILDDEFKKINTSVSIKGSSFLDMMDESYGFNHVFEDELVYAKNIKEMSGDYVKSDDTSESIVHYVNFPNSQSLNLNFKKKTKVKEIYLEFHSEFTISIFGVEENGNTVMLFENVNSNMNLYLNTIDKEFVKIFIIGNGNLKNYFKYSNVYTSNKNSENVNGFIFRKINDVLKVKEIYFLSDSQSQLFSYTQQEYEEFLKMVVKDEKNAIDKFINDRFLVLKNEKIELNKNENILFLVEFLSEIIDKTKKIKIYGKEA